MKLVQLPPGTFEMGAPASDSYAHRNEFPQHQVMITKPFSMSVTEVTVQQFRTFVEATGYVTAAEKAESSGYNSETHTFEYNKKGFTWKYAGWEQTDDHPVVNVNWFDAVEFCNWLGKRERQQYRLPTEAEWEYACRAGTEFRFTTGKSLAQLKTIANIQDQSLYRLRPRFSNSKDFSYLRNPVDWDDGHPFTAPVGRFRPNEFGLHDMLGNVAEWCSDWHHNDSYANAVEQDPSGPETSSSARVLRGGAFLHQPKHCRVTARIGGRPSYHNYIIGFRVVADFPSAR